MLLAIFKHVFLLKSLLLKKLLSLTLFICNFLLLDSLLLFFLLLFLEKSLLLFNQLKSMSLLLMFLLLDDFLLLLSMFDIIVNILNNFIGIFNIDLNKILSINIVNIITVALLSLICFWIKSKSVNITFSLSS